MHLSACILHALLTPSLRGRCCAATVPDCAQHRRAHVTESHSPGFFQILLFFSSKLDFFLLRFLSQAVLALLASVSRIHVVASIDSINAPLCMTSFLFLFTLSSLRFHLMLTVWDQSQLALFRWVFEDCTTMRRYLAETSYEATLTAASNAVTVSGAFSTQFLPNSFP